MSRLGSKRARREFEESVYTLAPKLYRLAFARLGHVHDAEDVVQETYLKAFKNIDSYRPGTNIEAWLSLILLNTIRDHLRHIQKSAVMVPLDENEDLSIGFTDSPEMRLERNEVGADVLAALKATPEWLVSPLLLRVIHDLSYKQIAEVLGVPIGTVMSRLSRCRQYLRGLLQPDPSGLAQSRLMEGPARKYVAREDEQS